MNSRSLPISVVIPAYNSSSALPRAIASAWASGVSEVIVVDDGSSDNTRDVAEKSATVCLSQQNQGASVARANGALKVRYQYTCFLDSDDELVSDGLRKLVDILDENAEVAVAVGKIMEVYSDGSSHVRGAPYSPVNTTSLLKIGYGPEAAGAALIRTSAVRQQGELLPAPLNARFADDYELLIRLSRIGHIETADFVVLRYTAEGGKSHSNYLRVLECKELIRSHYSKAWDISIQPMTTVQIKQSVIAKRIRNHRKNRNWMACLGLLAYWFFLSPTKAMKILFKSFRNHFSHP